MAEKKNKKYDEKKDVLERAYPQTQEFLEIKREASIRTNEKRIGNYHDGYYKLGSKAATMH